MERDYGLNEMGGIYMSGCGLDLCYTVPAVEKNCMVAARTSDGVRPPSWRVGIGRSARGSRAARPLASLRSIAPGSAPRAARSARLRLRILLLRTESSRSARLRLLAGGYRDLGFQASETPIRFPRTTAHGGTVAPE